MRPYQGPVILPYTNLSSTLLILYAVIVCPDRALQVWLALMAVMYLKAVSRTFTCPASSLLLNDCVSNPIVLAVVNGLGQSVTSAAIIIGPSVGGWALGLRLKYNLVVAPWLSLVMVGFNNDLSCGK